MQLVKRRCISMPMQAVLGEDLPKLLTGNELMLSF